MAQIDILKDVLDYSLRKFPHKIIGSNIYFCFNNERYAKAMLKKDEIRNEYNGVSIVYVSKLYGLIDTCDIMFKDVFIDSKHASVNIEKETDEFAWFRSQKPTYSDLNKLAEHVDRFINLIGDFGDDMTDYAGSVGMALQAVSHGMNQQLASVTGMKQGGYELIEDLDVLTTPESVTESILPSDENTIDADVIEEGLSSDLLATDITDDSDVSTENEQTDTHELTESLEKPEIKESFNEKPAESAIKPEVSKGPAKRGGLLGFFKGKEKKEPVKQHIPIAPALYSDDSTSDSSESMYAKPFACWDVGEKDAKDVRVALYNIDNGCCSLVITGKGEMMNFKNVPWSKYAELIKIVKIEDGVTNIGNNAFKSFSMLKSITLPDSIISIGESAFEFCSQLEEVRWSEKLKVIQDFAFAGNEKLKEVHLPDSVQEIRDYAFDFSKDFTIICVDPKKLHLGAGISYSDIKSESSIQPTRISASNYMQ